MSLSMQTFARVSMVAVLVMCAKVADGESMELTYVVGHEGMEEEDLLAEPAERLVEGGFEFVERIFVDPEDVNASDRSSMGGSAGTGMGGSAETGMGGSASTGSTGGQYNGGGSLTTFGYSIGGSCCDACEGNGKISSLTFKYMGANGGSNTQSQKYFVDGNPNFLNDWDFVTVTNSFNSVAKQVQVGTVFDISNYETQSFRVFEEEFRLAHNESIQARFAGEALRIAAERVAERLADTEADTDDDGDLDGEARTAGKGKSGGTGKSRSAGHTHRNSYTGQFPSQLELYISYQGQLISTISFHTSCSVPILIGEQYGSVLVTGFKNTAGITNGNCVPFTSYGVSTGKTGKTGNTGMGKSGKSGKGSYNAQTSLPVVPSDSCDGCYSASGDMLKLKYIDFVYTGASCRSTVLGECNYQWKKGEIKWSLAVVDLKAIPDVVTIASDDAFMSEIVQYRTGDTSYDAYKAHHGKPGGTTGGTPKGGTGGGYGGYVEAYNAGKTGKTGKTGYTGNTGNTGKTGKTGGKTASYGVGGDYGVGTKKGLDIQVGDIIRLTVEQKFPAYTDITISTPGGQCFEEISIHTSCSVPLLLGDEFGSLKVVAIGTADGDVTCSVDDTYGDTSGTCKGPMFLNEALDVTFEGSTYQDFGTDFKDWLDNNGGATAATYGYGQGVTWSNNWVVGVFPDKQYDGYVLHCPRSMPVTFAATSDCGKTSYTTATYTTLDTEAPVLQPAKNIFVLDDGYGNVAEYEEWFKSNGGASCTGCNKKWKKYPFRQGGVLPAFVRFENKKSCPVYSKITFTASDSCGNEASTSGTFTVLSNVQYSAYESQTSLSVLQVQKEKIKGKSTYEQLREAFANSTFNFGEARLTVAEEPPLFRGEVPVPKLDECPVTLEFNFIAEDGCGAFIEVDGQFVLTDTEAPQPTTPVQDYTVESDHTGNYADLESWLESGSYQDATGYKVTASKNAEENRGQSEHCDWSIKYSFDVSDPCGNTYLTDATFTIQDTQAPVISNPPYDYTVESDGSGNQNELAWWLRMASPSSSQGRVDSLSGIDDYEWLEPEPIESRGGLGDGCAVTVSYAFKAVDSCGNTATIVASFTIMDSTAPYIVVPPVDTTVDDSSYLTNPSILQNWLDNNGGASAMDSHVQDRVLWEYQQTTPSEELRKITDTGCSMTLLFNFTVTDTCGNALSVVGGFTIKDVSPPKFNRVADSRIYNDSSIEARAGGDFPSQLSEWVSTNGGAVAIDPTLFTPHPVNWGYEAEGVFDGCKLVLTFTFKASDQCGHISHMMASFTIYDTMAPRIQQNPQDLHVEDNGKGNVEEVSEYVITQGAAQARDIGGSELKQALLDFGGQIEYTNQAQHRYEAEPSWAVSAMPRSQAGTCTVTLPFEFTALDSCGNSHSVIGTVVIIDTKPPVIDIPSQHRVVIDDGEGNADQLQSWLLEGGGAKVYDLAHQGRVQHRAALAARRGEELRSTGDVQFMSRVFADVVPEAKKNRELQVRNGLPLLRC